MSALGGKCMTGCGRLALWCGPCCEISQDKVFDAVAKDVAQWLRETYDEEGVHALADRIEAGDWCGSQRQSVGDK